MFQADGTYTFGLPGNGTGGGGGVKFTMGEPPIPPEPATEPDIATTAGGLSEAMGGLSNKPGDQIKHTSRLCSAYRLAYILWIGDWRL